MRAPLPDGRINVMQEPWFDPATYRSDSNQHWRSGLPARRPARRRVPVAAAPHPSGDLGVPGRDDGQTMRAMLEAEKARRLQQLADDRIDLA